MEINLSEGTWVVIADETLGRILGVKVEGEVTLEKALSFAELEMEGTETGYMEVGE